VQNVGFHSLQILFLNERDARYLVSAVNAIHLCYNKFSETVALGGRLTATLVLNIEIRDHFGPKRKNGTRRISEN
jgi:hypothetical protein